MAEESQDRRARAGGPSSPSKAAVLSAAGLVTRSARWIAPAHQLAVVLERAAQLDLRQLWIGPETVAQLQLAEGRHPWLGEAIRAGWSTKAKGLEPWVELAREQAHVELVFPSWDDRNPFRATSAGQLLEALDLYAGALRLRYRWTPGNSGVALMRAVHTGPTAVELPETAKPAPPALEPADWLRGSWLDEQLPDLGWLHAYDVNGMFLAACSSVELGFGEPVHHKRYLAGLPTKAPGFFRASVRPPQRRAFHSSLPFVVDGKRHWYPGPVLDLLHEGGARITITEAWTYPERHRWLAPWYERLRDARTALLAQGGPAAAVALDAVKRTYTAALGRLAASWMQPGDAAFRPDWRLAVIARAFANMQRHLAKVHAHSGVVPLARDADLVVYACTIEAPELAADQLGLELHETQLGKWKHAGTIPADEVGGEPALGQLLAAMGAR